MLGISFLGLSYLLVYVGAVSILFLFILMLINVRISELLSDTSSSIPLAVLIAISFNSPINQVLPYSIAAFNSYTSLINSFNNIWFNYFSDNLNNFFTYFSSNREIAYVTSKL
jgi:NADH-ubiquinone oxidoreductase chain 6